MEPESVNTSTRKKSSLVMTCFTYVNSIINIGISGIPYAFKIAGFGLGFILVFSFAIMTRFSLQILIEAGKAVKVTTYHDLVKTAFGKRASYYLTFIQFIYPFILMISFNMLVGSNIIHVLTNALSTSKDSLVPYRTVVILICNMLVILPLSLLSETKRLSEMSVISLVFVFIMIGITFLELALKPHIPETNQAYRFVNWGIIQAMNMIALTFICHHNAFILYNQLENPTQDRWNKATIISTFSSFAVIIVFGIAGYGKFTGHSDQNIFMNFCESDGWADFAKIAFTATLMLTYPIEIFAAREVIDKALFGEKECTQRCRTFTTVIIVLAAFIISTGAKCWPFILQVTSVVAAVPLGYVLPAALYWHTSESEMTAITKGKVALMLLIGLVMTIGGGLQIVFDIIDERYCTKYDIQTYCIGQIKSNSTEYI